MQRYLATAAVFPGLFLAWNANKQQSTVFAKSSSKSSSRSSSSRSSSSSSSKSSSIFSSSKSSSSSSSQGSRSLTKKSSFSNSSIAKKPYTRQQGKSSYVNKRRFIREQQRDKQISIFGLIGLLGTVSVYFYRYEKLRYGIRHIRNALKNCENINLLSFSNKLDGKLVYGHGPLKIHSWSNQALTDPLFGIEASTSEHMRLYRKVEIYKENEEKPEKNAWFDANYIQSFHPEIFHPCMKEAIILPEKVEIGDYELSMQQLTKLNWDGQKKMSFDTDAIDDYYSDMQHIHDSASSATKTGRRFGKQKELTNEKEESGELAFSDKQKEEVREEFRVIQRMDREQTEQELKNMYGTHPFTYANKSGKEIMFQDDYIYVANDIDNPEEGDIRISFHELKPILYATLIAQQSGKSFTEHQISQLKNLKLNLRLFSGGKEKEIKFDMINIIKEGKINMDELIKDHMTETKKQSRSVSYVLATIIYMIYCAIISSIGQMMNPFNWFGKGAQERRQKNRQNVVQKRGNGYVFSKNNNSGFLSSLFATPFAAAHIASVSLAAMARAYAGLLCGGILGGYLLYTFYQDYKDDQQLMNSIPEGEEQQFDEELDEGEKEILSMLQKSEVHEEK